jgi:putative zinc finger protein
MMSRHLPSTILEMTCAQVTQLIARYLASGLSPERVLACAAHLRNCADCVAFLNTYKHTVHVLQTGRDEDVSVEMQVRVRRFLATMIQTSAADW